MLSLTYCCSPPRVEPSVVWMVLQVHPKLLESLKKVYTWFTPYGDKKSQIFANFKLSSRGALRRPPNVFTWVHSLEQLVHTDSDINNVVRAWNEQASSGSSVVGAKAVALRLILSMPKDVRTAIMLYVGKVSWELAPWSEDSGI